MDRSVYQARWILAPILGFSVVFFAVGLLVG